MQSSQEDLNNFVEEKARLFSTKYPQFEVIFGKDSIVWKNHGREDTTSSVVSIIIPWNTPLDEVKQIAEYMNANAYSN